MKLNYTRPDTRSDGDPVDYTDTNIGTLSWKTWSTLPAVQLPHGMMEVFPYTTPGIGDRYLADRIYAFAAGGFALMPVVGPPGSAIEANASEFDHDLELATPYMYAALLEDSEIEVACTVSRHAALIRCFFPPTDGPSLIIYLGREANVTVESDGSLTGYQAFFGTRIYFQLEFDRTPQHVAIAASEAPTGRRLRRSLTPSKTITASFGTTASGADIRVRAAISYISAAQAKQNLRAELPDWDFEKVCAQARGIWNAALSRITVSGGTEAQKRTFYTSIYRCLQRMKNITEGGRYFSGFDGQVHEAGDMDFYNMDQPWDTYRCARPLQFLIEPENIDAMIQSYVRMCEQLGWVPITPTTGGERATMVGRHITAIIADAHAKGFRDFDLAGAYEGARTSALERTMIPWVKGPATELDRFYNEHAYFPSRPVREDMKVEDPEAWRDAVRDLVVSEMPHQITWLPDIHEPETVPEVNYWHRRQSVSITLENAYDDWCLAQLATALGRDDDAAHFTWRACGYRTLFNAATGFMWPKTADGEWVEPFHPTLSGGFAGEEYYAEMNAWSYTFHVQHDVLGLVDLMGGRQAFTRKLDELFTEQYVMDKPAFLGQFPDASGLIGQYSQGNEPSFHIPYLYNYAGAPWRAQRRVRDIMKLWYSDAPMGLSGDDDIGSLSSWYTFSAMGFYPVCPGSPVYDIGSPLFETATLHLPDGKSFIVEAREVSERNKYIQSATLNGEALDRPWFRHQDIVGGGRLVLHMGPRPNKAWGSAPGAAAPSRILE